MSDVTPAVRLEQIIDAIDVSDAPANRLEALIMGEDIEPATRLEALIKNAISSGGSGVESESGEIIPETDTQNLDVSYSVEHDKPAFFFLIKDANTATPDDAVENSGILAFFVGYDQIFGGYWSTGNSVRYAAYCVYSRLTTGSNPAYNNYSATTPYTSNLESSSTYYRYYSKLSGFRARSGGSTYTWKAGRTYKWFALWI